jgi:predicted GIY-YIG superfamily endonuclease
MNNFNILDCFDVSIDNLDVTKNYIYVLELIEDRYYVGRTGNILRRIEEHFTNNGANYTKAFKPLKVLEVVEEKTNEDEKIKTLEYMSKYGWEKVRGYSWCSVELLKPPKIHKKNVNKRKKEYIIIPQEYDEKLKILYFNENKDIIEIGNYLNKTPGQIAYRLEKLGVIERKQLALGYYSYITSEMYRENCKIINDKKNKKLIQDKNKEKIILNNIQKDIIDIKTDIGDIKNRIRLLLKLK